MIDCRRLFSDRRALPCMLAASVLTVVGMVLTRSAERAEKAVGATPYRPNATLAATNAEVRQPAFRLDSTWRLSAASWEIEKEEEALPEDEEVDPDGDPLAAAFTGLDVMVLR